ncbi:hypothetical protein M426DRAFT_25172 [Hypoxylon sp. CI-4A]|nr:hypothetical protein M426DRAFT_25172 [Hypoxylon sp. CI-4A]
MHWSHAEPDFDDNDFKNFKYRHGSFKIIRKLLIDTEGPVCFSIRSPEDLENWINEVRHTHWCMILLTIHRTGASFTRSINKGLLLCMSPHAFSVVTLAQMHLARHISRFRGMGFADLSSCFIFPVLLFGLFDAARHTFPKLLSHTVLQTQRTLFQFQVYTARMSPTWADDKPRNDIALSTTYIAEKRLSLSVFYGCMESQSYEIEGHLANAGDAIDHPILTANIFAELDWNRLKGLVNETTRIYTLMMDSLCCSSREMKVGVTQENESIEPLSSVFSDTKEISKQIKSAKRQILSMRGHIYPTSDLSRRESCKDSSWSMSSDEKTVTSPVSTDSRALIYERLLEIDSEYDEKLEQCSAMAESLTFTTQLVRESTPVGIISFM